MLLTTVSLYMAVYKNIDTSVEEVIEAHQKDIEVQEKYGVDYKRYWVDEDNGTIFCLFEGPTKKRVKKSTKRRTQAHCGTKFTKCKRANNRHQPENRLDQSSKRDTHTLNQVLYPYFPLKSV